MIGDLVRWFVWFPCRWLIQRLPLTLLPKLGKALGVGLCAVSARNRRLRVEELRRLMGDAIPSGSMPRIVRQSFVLDYTKVLQSFFYPKLSQALASRLFTYKNEEFLEQALHNGKGGIILLAHFGANQFSIPALGFKGYPINQLGSTPEDWNRLNRITPSRIQQRIFRLRLEHESRLPVRFVYIAASMRPAFECLSRNEFIIMAFDGRAGSQWLQIPVCGRIMNVSTGPFSLARLAGSPIIPLFMVFQADGTHCCVIEAPYEVPKTADRSDDLRRGAMAFARLLEGYLTAHPDHYAGLMLEARRRAPVDAVPLFTDYKSEQDLNTEDGAA